MLYFNRTTGISFIFLSINLISQTAAIKGNVKDELGIPVSFSTIALIHSLDSLLVKGQLIDENGNYIISEVSPGTYRLISSYLGYQNVYTSVFEIKSELRFKR